MNTMEMSVKLGEIQGCLSNLKTTTARRRFKDDYDLSVPGVDPFQIDAEQKIANSKAIRRAQYKTQVTTNPRNLHIRNRLTHMAEVTAVGSLISGILGLNVELTKAIALGHDIGHTPFGHDGEDYIRKKAKKPFNHANFAVFIAQSIERHGEGLNLTHEVLSGISQHSRGKNELKTSRRMSEEAKVVMFADKMAFLTGDYNDFSRIGFEPPSELVQLMESLGRHQTERINSLVYALCLESADKGRVSFEDSKEAAKFRWIKDMMYEIYPRLNASNAEEVLERIYLFLEKLDNGVDPALLISLMTDEDVMFLADQTAFNYSHFAGVTVAELVKDLAGKKLPWWKLDLDW